MGERNSLQTLTIEGTMDSSKFSDFGAVSKQRELGLSLFFFAYMLNGLVYQIRWRNFSWLSYFGRRGP